MFKDGIYVTVNELHYNDELVGFRFRVLQESGEQDVANYFDVSLDALSPEQIEFLSSKKVKITRLMAHDDLLISYYENEVQQTAMDVSGNKDTIKQLITYLPDSDFIPQSPAEGEVVEMEQADDKNKIEVDKLLEQLVSMRGKKITLTTVGLGEISGLFKTTDQQDVLVNFLLPDGEEVQFLGGEFLGLISSVD